LLAYALSGGQPSWASILPAGGVGNIEPAAPQPGALPSLDRQLWQTRYGDRISPAYQGSARFSSTGFALIGGAGPCRGYGFAVQPDWQRRGLF